MNRPTDRARLIFPDPQRPGEFLYRHWWIMQPPPTVALALQLKVAAACGDAARWVLEAFFTSPEQAEDFAAERDTMGEALALQTLRRARAGQALFSGEDGIFCTSRLWAVLRMAQARSGGTMDALTLLGEPERVPKSQDYRWTRPSLLHRVLLASGLRFDGEVGEHEPPAGALPDGPLRPPPAMPAGASAKDPGAFEAYWVEVRRHKVDGQRLALRDAVADGSITAFVAALDGAVCSPDELALLSVWACLHLWRPF